MTPFTRAFANGMSAVPAGAPLAVACSGGPDSMALALLAKDWARGAKVTVFTVDHGLRDASAAEAATVARWSAAHGLAHRTLRWEGVKPASNLQAEARRARYALLRAACEEAGIAFLLLGHHQDDQAETVLLRLARGSGVDGLSAMRPYQRCGEITLVRPLLHLPKQTLLDHLAQEKQDFITDPSNDSDAYARTRLRRLMPLLAEEGLTPARLAATAQHLARARMTLEARTRAFLHDHACFYAGGFAALHALPEEEETVLRVVRALVQMTGGEEGMPRLAETARLLSALQTPTFRAATLQGCLVRRCGNVWWWLREPARLRSAIPLRPGARWDGRFEIMLPEGQGKGFTCGPLLPEGWRALAPLLKAARLPVPREVPKAAWHGVPALRDAKNMLCLVPHLGYAALPYPCRIRFLPEAGVEAYLSLFPSLDAAV